MGTTRADRLPPWRVGRQAECCQEDRGGRLRL